MLQIRKINILSWVISVYCRLASHLLGSCQYYRQILKNLSSAKIGNHEKRKNKYRNDRVYASTINESYKWQFSLTVICKNKHWQMPTTNQYLQKIETGSLGPNAARILYCSVSPVFFCKIRIFHQKIVRLCNFFKAYNEPTSKWMATFIHFISYICSDILRPVKVLWKLIGILTAVITMCYKR